MCGRFSFAVSDRIIEEHYGFVPSALSFRYNCAPSQLLAVITDINPANFSFFKWGFIPFWAKNASIGNNMVNARAETITSKPAFKKSLQTKRCLVPADSFYEWSDKKDKNPYRIMLKNQPVFSMAGIWSEWKSPDNEIVFSFAVITTGSNDIIKQIHDRMPVILDTAVAEKLWLNNTDAGISELLKPLDSEKMVFYPVSKKVNSPKNDFPEIHLQETEPGLF